MRHPPAQTSPALTAITAATPPKSITPSIPEEALLETEPLTLENLNELNQETGSATKPSEKKVSRYRNIPSLDAITARLTKARSLSVDGSVCPPEAEMIIPISCHAKAFMVNGPNSF
ncbi:hypothetical protein HD554DRAFT_2172237 [Boletus coccyginus]|nr:hypothetical protein HD554DRAFT_2172237 [Boletus coccyginus]